MVEGCTNSLGSTEKLSEPTVGQLSPYTIVNYTPRQDYDVVKRTTVDDGLGPGF